MDYIRSPNLGPTLESDPELTTRCSPTTKGLDYDDQIRKPKKLEALTFQLR